MTPSAPGLPPLGNMLTAATCVTAGLLTVPSLFRDASLDATRAVFLLWCLSYAGGLAIGIWRLRPGRSPTLFRVLSGLALVQAWIYLLFWSRVVFQNGNSGEVLPVVALCAFAAGPVLALVAAAWTRRAIWFTMAQVGGPASALLAGIAFS